jgi:hypothetical protein
VIAVDRSTRNMLLAAGLAVAVAVNLFARGMGVGIRAYRAEWIWRPLAREISVHLLPAAGVAAVLVALVWWLCREGRWEAMRGWGRGLSLAALVLLAFALQCAMINAVGEPWVAPGAIIASPVSTTFFAISHDVHSVPDYLANYHQIMPTLPYHAATHPPGLTLFYWAVRRTCDWLPVSWVMSSPTVAKVQWYSEYLGVGFPPGDAVAAILSALLLALAGSSSILPVYVLARRLAGAEAGLVAACMMASIPSLLLLSASSDQLVLFFAVRVVCLAYLAWRSDRLWVAALAGVGLAVGAFVSLGLLVLVAWLVVWAVLGWVRSADRAATLRRFLARAAAGATGFVSLYLILFLATGYRAWTVAYIGLFAHRQETTVEFPRTYWKWVLMNPVEMAVFAGLALVAAALWTSLRRDTRASSSLYPFLLSWVVVLAALDVSGIVRAEVGRIWLFLMWPLAVAAGGGMHRLRGRGAAVTMLVAIQLCQALAMRGYLTMYDIR